MSSVSVIIPVYNAEPFIHEAVLSALSQPHCAEIILVEDASTDDSLAICHTLAKKYPTQVRVIQHDNHANLGAAMSRWVGLQHSTSPYIAFLDADDTFAPDHLNIAMAQLDQFADIDGVYGVTQWVYTDKSTEERVLRLLGELPKETALTRPTPSQDLFDALVSDYHGHFSINTLVCRREALMHRDYFSPRLVMGEDVAFTIKLASRANLIANGTSAPIMFARVHGGNRSTGQKNYAQVFDEYMTYWRSLNTWGKNNLSASQHNMVLFHWLRYFVYHTPKRGRIPKTKLFPIQKRLRLIKFAIQNPQALFKRGYWRHILPKQLL